MFEKKKKELFPWKISALILVGVFVLSSGVYIGTRLKNNGVQTGEVVSTSANMNEKSKEAFGLNKNCEVWLQSEGENETNYKRTLTMAGIVPESLLDKTKSEIVSYFKKEYPSKKIKSMDKNEIILVESKYSDNKDVQAMTATIKGKYTIENDNGNIALYKYDDSGSKTLVEKTKIRVDSLPKTVQDEIKKGVVMDTEEDAYSRLEDFAS
ncbi:hypothetical protein KWV16_14915 [Clostridioides difficile]|nr:hypothetical protein [Clostridioides difficile]